MNKRVAGNQRGIALITVGLLLIMAALVLTVYNLWDERRADSATNSIMGQLSYITDTTNTAHIADVAGITEEAGVPQSFPDSGTVCEKQVIPDYLANPDMEMPTVTIDGNLYIGVLTIAALDLSLPVMEDWSYPKLKISPNRYQGSAYTGNMIIAGHNYRKHFGNLRSLTTGDEVLFTDVDGNLFTYAVVEIEVLKGTELERIKSGDWDLTLFTCTLGGENRVTVRCVRDASDD